MGAKVGVVFTGITGLSRALARDGEVWRRVQDAAAEGMTENTEDLLGRSMREAPVREGTLRGSGTAAVYANGKAVSRSGFKEVKPAGDDPLPAEDPDRFQMQARQVKEGGSGDAIVGEVGFNEPYALVQHERLDYKHPKGGKAKYLEDPLKMQAAAYEQNLQKHVSEALA